MMTSLPLREHAETLRALLVEHGRVVLSAPPGSGKSTQVPQILWPEAGVAVVLQPRRIAARNLAMRVAAERGEELGRQVGFQVRFERSRSAQTRVMFETYGVFWQQLLQDPALPGVSLVILDEFHERTLESDACLAWLRELQRSSRPDLRLVVMSATLAGDELASYLGEAPHLEIDSRPHPVAIDYLPPQPGEPIWAHAARGFRHLVAEGLDGSVLVFMPGAREIRRAVEAIAPDARARGYEVLALSGSEPVEAQQRALRLPAEAPCVIVATNVAETSLTIPGVVAVLDSGLARHAAYDAERDLDTLHLGWISHQNATQRAGRAGRLGPGRCLRLWARSLESSMPQTVSPEIARLDLGRLALACHALPRELSWLTPPPAQRWAKAQERLRQLGAIADRGLSPLGRRLLALPLPPALARVLVAAGETGVGPHAAAMSAILEAADRRSVEDDGDLYRLGLALLRDPQGKQWDREVRETFRDLMRLVRPSEAEQRAAEAVHAPDAPEELARRERVTRAWLTAYGDRLAFRQDRAYVLSDGRKAIVPGQQVALPLVIALELHESGGAGQARQISLPLYLPCESAWIEGGREAERVVLCEWDAAKGRVVQEEHVVRGGVTLEKRVLPAAEWDWDRAEALLVERLERGESRIEAWDEDVEQLALRIRMGAEAWPEAGLPRLDADDWHLLHHELCRGKSSPADISKDDLLGILREYVGYEGMLRLDRAAPRTWKLPGGRQARITYCDGAPPELSARLGDMIGLEGRLNLYEGRVPVLFDILAPNYRTVQKTFDMTGFWRNTYPEVKKELRRRYPKHPWP